MHLTEAEAGRGWLVEAKAAAKALLDVVGPGNVAEAEGDRA